MTRKTLPDLAAAWLDLWNGNLDLLPSVAAEGLVTHTVSADGTRLERLEGRDALGDLVREVHRCFDERTTYEVGPIVQEPYLVVRWHSTGRYRGGVPGIAPGAVGCAVDFRGIDIVRVEGGVAVEFWMSLDRSVLMHQLGGGSP